MGKHAQVSCALCLKAMRSDALKRHLKTCKGKPAEPAPKVVTCECLKDLRRVNLKKHKETCPGAPVRGPFERPAWKSQAPTLIGQMRDVLENLPELASNGGVVHLVYPHKHLREGVSEADVEQHFAVLNNFACECGVKQQTPHPHRHLIGKPRYGADRATLKQYLKDDAPRPLITKLLTDLDDPTQVMRFLNLCLYLQTERGWHYKLDHSNPLTLPGLPANYALRRALVYRSWEMAEVYPRTMKPRIALAKWKLAQADSPTPAFEVSDAQRAYLQKWVTSKELSVGRVEEHLKGLIPAGGSTYADWSRELIRGIPTEFDLKAEGLAWKRMDRRQYVATPSGRACLDRRNQKVREARARARAAREAERAATPKA